MEKRNRGLLQVTVRNTLTSPKPRDGLGDLKHRESETFNDGLAKSGVWGTDTPNVLWQAIYFLACKLLPLFLAGWVLWGEQSPQISPRFMPSLFRGWPLFGILFPPFLHTHCCFYVSNLPTEWARVKVLGIPFSLHLPGLSSFVTLMVVTTSVTC